LLCVAISSIKGIIPEATYSCDLHNCSQNKRNDCNASFCRYFGFSCSELYIQGVFESCAEILTTSYWLHVELGKNILKILCQKIK
jgi:PAS domain-containing protein